MNDLDYEYAKECFDYDPKTGILIWKKRPRSHFKTTRGWNCFNAQRAGNQAGNPFTRFGKQYLQVEVNRKRYKVHRIIWMLQTTQPAQEVDHINGNGLDNRWCNLRSVSHRENQKNRRRPKNNKSGVIGVHWRPDCERWEARISINKKIKILGYFPKDQFDEAVALRKEAEIKYGFHKNHGEERKL